MLKFIRAGMYTSVQDGGREGQRQWGISRCGALDKPAMTIANLLVGNAPEAAALHDRPHPRGLTPVRRHRRRLFSATPLRKR